MAECVRCGGETAMFLNDLPVCVPCYHADRDRKLQEKQQDPDSKHESE